MRRLAGCAGGSAEWVARMARLAAAIAVGSLLVVGCEDDGGQRTLEVSAQAGGATGGTQVGASRPRAAPPDTRAPTAVAIATPDATRGAAALPSVPPRTPSPQAAGLAVRAAHGWAEEEAHVCRPGEAFGRWAWQDFVGWSPDGATILFSRGAELYGLTAEGTRIWPVADAGTSTVLGEAGTTIPFAVSPDGRRVVFATCRYGKPNSAIPSTNYGGFPTRVWRLGYELALVNVDGTDPQRLTTNALEFDSYPAWAPDGRRIAHLYARTGVAGAFRLQVTPLDGGQPFDATRLVRPGFRQQVLLAPQAPAWSPDGRQLAVRGVTGAVYVVDADNGWAHQIAPYSQITSNVVGGPAWSPDGTRLAVLNVIDGDFALMTFDVDLRDVRWLATLPARPNAVAGTSWAPTVAWSPDGSKILVIPQPGLELRTGNEAGAGADLYVVTAAESARGRVAPIGFSSIYVYAAAWAPDGARLAFAAMDNRPGIDRRWGADEPTRWGDVQVFTVAADGSDWHRLARREHDGRLEPHNATRAYDQGLVDACRTGGAVPDAASNPGLVDDCAALLALWARSDELEHANWSVERPLSTWDGVAVGGSPPRVRGLRLADGELRSREARALRWLTELRRLELSNSGLSYLPRELFQLEHLEELQLVASFFGGHIPVELGHLRKLRHLDLSANSLTGSIPPELGQLTGLTHLGLSGNQLSGPIPVELTQLTNLTVLNLSNNELTGRIPSELGKVTELRRLLLSGNQLTGPIPAELGQLTNLTVLDLTNNQLTGRIPAELSQLTELREVRLSRNQLTGCVPVGLPVGDRERLGLPDCEAAA